jgi:hypothetical protein
MRCDNRVERQYSTSIGSAASACSGHRGNAPPTDSTQDDIAASRKEYRHFAAGQQRLRSACAARAVSSTIPRVGVRAASWPTACRAAISV